MEDREDTLLSAKWTGAPCEWVTTTAGRSSDSTLLPLMPALSCSPPRGHLCMCRQWLLYSWNHECPISLSLSNQRDLCLPGGFPDAGSLHVPPFCAVLQCAHPGADKVPLKVWLIILFFYLSWKLTAISGFFICVIFCLIYLSILCTTFLKINTNLPVDLI